jgi:FixJ family two-component response regulator
MTPHPVVCVIDDDVSVLKAVSRLLSALGYTVRSFKSAHQFLERPSQADSEVGCLVLDVHMPGMSGLELQEELARAGRDLPIVFVTGAEDETLRQRAFSWGAIDFLEKPFTDSALERAVRYALTCRTGRLA